MYEMTVKQAAETLTKFCKKYDGEILKIIADDEDCFGFTVIFPNGLDISIVRHEWSAGSEKGFFELGFYDEYDGLQTSGGWTIENIVIKLESRMFVFNRNYM